MIEDESRIFQTIGWPEEIEEKLQGWERVCGAIVIDSTKLTVECDQVCDWGELEVIQEYALPSRCASS